MRRIIGLAAALWLAAAGAMLAPVLAPQSVLACSCMPTTMADFAAEPDVTVFAGQAGGQLGGRIPMAVEAWYKGPAPASVVWLAAAQQPDGQGNVVFDTCSLTVQPGERWLLIVYGGPPEPYATSNCTPSVRLDHGGAAAALAEATEVFGAPRPPPSEPPQPPGDTPAPAVGQGVGWEWIFAGAAATLLLFGAVVLLALRRRPLS